VDPFNPKDTPFELENTTEFRPLLVVPAEKFTLAAAGAATETEIALLAMVPEAFVPWKAAVAATKSDPRLEAIAVVRYAGRLIEIPAVSTVSDPPVIALTVPA
jgi:hypothetical protein